MDVVITTITCADCGERRQGIQMQPKAVAKRFGWKHGEAKGVWRCPKCQEYVKAKTKR